jgi:hypothetical protein
VRASRLAAVAVGVAAAGWVVVRVAEWVEPYEDRVEKRRLLNLPDCR